MSPVPPIPSITVTPPPARWEYVTLRLWHAALAGGFLVAYLSADEDTYRMHVFSGYWVVTALALRLGLSRVGSAAGPLALPSVLGPLRAGRSRLMVVMAAALIALMTVVGLSGILADALPAAEDLHEGLSNAGLGLILAHVALVVWMIQGRRLLFRLRSTAARALPAAMIVLGLAAGAAQAGDAARDAILAGYAKEAKAADSSFTGFSAARGEAIYRAQNTASPDFASCATCHTNDPTQPGRHAKTGREIPPAAVSANPKRFTDAEKVEERFQRDCKTVLGRACTARDKGDYITFLASK